MRHLWIIFLLLTLISTLGFAQSSPQNLTIVSSINLSTPFVNSRDNLTIFNLSIIPFGGNANITGINITINTGNAGPVSGNISKVYVFNSLINSTNLLGTNSSINTSLTNGSKIFVNFSAPFILNATQRTGLLVVFEISNSTKRGVMIGGNLSAPDDIAVNITIVQNVTLPIFNVSTTRDLHYNVSISPRIVDTSVDNQTFIYTLTPTGTDNASTVLINIPSFFTNLSVISVTRGSSAANLTSGVANTLTTSLINVTFDTASNERVEVYFKANTSSSTVSSLAFNSSVYSVESGLANVINASTDAIFYNLTNVTTMNIINLTTVSISKGVAVLNGSDYWEFNFTAHFNESVTGTLHFKMTNWTDNNNNTITLASCTPSCATIRQNINASVNTSKINITNNFDPNYGLGMSPARGNFTTLFLRMIVPAGSAVSQSWFATYVLLFRSTP